MGFFKKIAIVFCLILSILAALTAHAAEDEPINYLKAVINTDEAVEMERSTIFNASQSYIPDPDSDVLYEWDFGDGNRNEGSEVLHSYKEPGKYQVTLKITQDDEVNEASLEVFVYEKSLVLITDETEARDRIEVIRNYAEKEGVYIKIIDSFGSSTEFISEEILSKKLSEHLTNLQKSSQFIIWTKENAGLNALSRYIQNNPKTELNLSTKTLIVISDNISTSVTRVQRQFKLINPKSAIVAKEAVIYPLVETGTDKEFIDTLEKGGYEYQTVTAKSGQIRPWNFMAYFVNFLINKGIPDNTIALLLLLPVIATTVAFMRQFVGITTFGIYTPSIITLSFLVIGLSAGLMTLLTAVAIGAISRPMLSRVRMLFIPKMAVVMSVVALLLFLILFLSTYLNLFDASFLSLAIFPMLILSTLVEKFVSVKTEKGLSAASILMAETVFVSIVAYFLVGGEINLGFTTLQFEFIKVSLINHPEIVFVFILLDVLLGKWSGLRLLEIIRFREVLRHIEE